MILKKYVFEPCGVVKGMEVKPDPDHTDEVIARISDLTIARAMFDLAVVQYPGKLIMLCQKGRILRRSDRPS